MDLNLLGCASVHVIDLRIRIQHFQNVLDPGPDPQVQNATFSTTKTISNPFRFYITFKLF